MPRKELAYADASKRTCRRKVAREMVISDSDSSSIYSESESLNYDFSPDRKDATLSRESDTCDSVGEGGQSISSVPDSPESSDSTESDQMIQSEEEDESSSWQLDSRLNSPEEISSVLREWAVKTNSTLSSVSLLLKGLRSHSCFSTLPKDARTLLQTSSSSFAYKIVSPGQYVHMGLEKQLRILLVGTQICPTERLNLLINIDGLPLFKSSSVQVVPILASVVSDVKLKNRVFVIGIYCGPKKPDDMNLFLEDFVQEAEKLEQTNGFSYNGNVVSLAIIGFTCDAPAKSDVLGTKSFSGYYSCTRCTVRGSTVKRHRVFLDIDCPERTHESFVNWEDEQFRIRPTCLTRLKNLQFCRSFSVDYMHLVALGCVRTMLNTWMSGDKPHRLSSAQCDVISKSLISLRSYVVFEFNRKPRDLKCILRWKATEFRQFLLYVGPIVLKNILPKDKYTNFSTLTVAMAILLSPSMCGRSELKKYAKTVLIHFVKSVRVLYGDEFITHNFHNLIHLADDADFFCNFIPNFCLEDISAFKFENHLQTFKRLLRSSHRPLEQICRRMGEISLLSAAGTSQVDGLPSNHLFSLSVEHTNGPILPNCSGPQYKKAAFQLFRLSNRTPDNCVKIGEDIVLVENFAYSTVLNAPVLIGRKFIFKEDFFNVPCKSSVIGIFKCSRKSELRLWSLQKVLAKYCAFPFKSKYFVTIPLYHTL